MKTKKQKSLIVPALLFTFLGMFPLAFSLFEINSVNDTISLDVILPLLVGIIFEIFGLYSLLVTIRYKIKPFECYSMFLVEEIVPVNAENEEHLYNMCAMLDEALSAERVRQIEKALETNEESYAVLFKYCGKLNINKILSGDLIKKKLFDSTFLYIAKSRKFIVGQFYSCDVMKYGANFRIHVYEDDDFRKIETI